MRAVRLLALCGVVTMLLACSSQESPGAQQSLGGSGGADQDGAPDGPQPDGAGGVGGCDPQTQVSSKQCEDCVVASYAEAGACQAHREACLTDAECTAILTCLAACKDGQCETTCIQQHLDGTGTLFPYVACVDTACHDECFCEGCRFGVAKCNPCLEDKCAQSCAGCDRDTQCMALVYCMFYTCAPDDLVCQNACGDKFDAGVGPYVGMGQCGQDHCAAECGFVMDAGAD